MRKIFLMTILCLFAVLGINAQNTLNIHQKSGGVVSYAFSEKPELTYVDDNLHLKTTKVEVDYPLSNLEMMTFEDNDNIATGIISAEGIAEDTKIYNLNGVLLKTIPASEGKSVYNVYDLPSGTYIVKNGTTAYKVIKK